MSHKRLSDILNDTKGSLTGVAPTTGLNLDDNSAKALPPPTGYNSIHGYRIIQGVRYNDGDVLPTGHRCDAKKLSWAEWSMTHETFEQDVIVEGVKQGYTEKKPSPINKLQERIIGYIEKYDKLLILAFRGARKSVTGSLYVKRKILDEGATAIYFAGAVEDAETFTVNIREEFSTNPQILQDYGYIIWDKKGKSKNKMYWLSQIGSTVRDPGLLTGSSGKGRTGAHPKIIVCDDIIADDQKRSKKYRERVHNWFRSTLLPMCRGTGTKIIVIGTIKDADDIYMEIQKDMSTFYVVKIPAIIEWPNHGQTEPATDLIFDRWFYIKEMRDGRLMTVGVGNLEGGKTGFDEYNRDSWGLPGRHQYYKHDLKEQGYDFERMAMQEFLIVRAEMGEDFFQCEYQLQPITMVRGILKFQNLQYFNINDSCIPARHILKMNTHAMFDQAFGETEKSAFNAIFVTAGFEDAFYIMDIVVWRGGGPAMKVKKLEETMKEWPEIGEVGIDAGQINAQDTKIIMKYLSNVNFIPIYANQYEKKLREWGLEIPKVVIEFDSEVEETKKSKFARIYNQWSTRLAMNLIHIRRGVNIEGMTEFTDEWSFPKSKRVDVLDAGGVSLDLCARFMTAREFYVLRG